LAFRKKKDKRGLYLMVEGDGYRYGRLRDRHGSGDLRRRTANPHGALIREFRDSTWNSAHEQVSEWVLEHLDESSDPP
jgi:hypothetical protein